MQKWAKKMNRKKVEGLELTTIANIMIRIISIVQLIFTGVHVKALLLLENELCGFGMFLFILFGLVTMFETTRIRSDRMMEKIFTAVLCVVTSGFGCYLTSIYRYAIANQRSLETAAVSKAAGFSTAVIAVYLISCVLLVVDLIKHR